MSFPRYAAYKDSGVGWLGEIPAHWEVRPVRNLANIINGYPFDSALFDTTNGIPLVRIRDLDKQETETYYNGEFVENVAITSDDVLIGMDGDFNVGRWRGHGRALLNQRMCCIRGKTGIITRLLEYVLPSRLKLINNLTYATTVKHLASSQIEKSLVAVPPPFEQTAIAAFLDRETARIDALIAEQERLIVLLKEKRQAVISHAVTKGLNPGVEMKDSGVEWLGEVPAHWGTPTLNSRYFIELGKMLDEKQISGNMLVPYLRNIDVQWGAINFTNLPEMDISEAEYDRYTVQPGDILVCEGGEVGRAAIVESITRVVGFQKALHRLRARSQKDHVRYIFYTFVWAALTGVFQTGGTSTIAHLTGEQLRRYRFPRPPVQEQVNIAAFLDAATSRLNTLTTEARRAITLLQERRTALISAAVTGQIDVRGIAST